jgi:proteasome lid subunit RPN8/RPN11
MAWKELEPDFKKIHPSSLWGRLDFDKTINVISSLGDDLVVILNRSTKYKAYDFVSSIRVESGGILIGKVFDLGSEFKPIVIIEDCIPSFESEGTSVSLKMDSTIWSKVNASITKDQFVVGWFHSHPNLGAFFSGTDRATQRNFFREDYQIGWVIDPIRKEEAWFYGKDSVEISATSIIENSDV